MGKIMIEEMKAPQMGGRNRKIRICLPDGYDSNLLKRYPVLYMHDGQNMVDPSPLSGYSWNIELILKEMQKKHEIEGIIVVGIDTDEINRIPEYTQAIAKKAEKQVKKMGNGNLFLPEAHLYGRFIVDTLKPYIDQNYRTMPERENTGMFGSSCGGNVSLYLGTVYNDIFSIIGAFSPAYWLVEDDLFKRIEAKTFAPDTKIYHDMGTKEAPFAKFTFVRSAMKLQRLLLAKGFEDTRLKMVIDKDGLHTELFWQERFPNFIRFAFPHQVRS